MLTLRVIATASEREIVHEPGLSVAKILNLAGVSIRTPCGCGGMCGLCRIRVTAGKVNAPTDSELNCIPAERLRQGIRLGCQVTPLGDVRITIESAPR